MKRPLLILALLLGSSVGLAEENQWDGNHLLARCRKTVQMMEKESNVPGNATDNSFEAGYCVGFVTGAIAGYEDVYRCVNGGKPVECLHYGVTTEQRIRVVVKWMDSHPEKLHEDAYRLVFLALKEAFPCKPEVTPRPTAPRR